MHHSAIAAIVATLLSLGSAHPHARAQVVSCNSEQSALVAATITCGQASSIAHCFGASELGSSTLQACLVQAGCTGEEAEDEAIWAAEWCAKEHQEPKSAPVELRKLRARADTTTTSSTATESSTSTTSATSTSETSASATSTTATSTTASASTTSTSTSASSTASSSSTTSSSTASSTASTTSSAASSTSTSDDILATNSDGFPTVGYFVAVVLAAAAVGSASFICYSCCTERSKRKAAIKSAEESKAMMGL